MKTLALDPATRCGFAHSDGPSGVWNLGGRGKAPGGRRLVRLWAKLNEAAARLVVELVVFEAARCIARGHASAILVHAELQGTVKLWCELRGVPCRGVSPSEVKRRATGKGNAKKEQMVRAARRRWPDKMIADDNEADALWILDLATNPEAKPLYVE